MKKRYLKFLNQLNNGQNKACLEAIKQAFTILEAGEQNIFSNETIEETYGSQSYSMHENSASGFFAEPSDVIGYAILNNDVNELERLATNPVVPENFGNPRALTDDEPPRFNFNEQYHIEFEEDFERVIGRKDNQEALYKMLELVPEFFVCPVDFDTAMCKGYSKDLLLKFVMNLADSAGKEQVEEIYGWPYDSLVEFLRA